MAHAGQPKKFAVFDIDGTLIRWQMQHAIIDRLGRAGHLSAEDYGAIQKARADWKNREEDEGYRAYEDALVAVIESTLINIPFQAFDDAADDAFQKYHTQVYRYTRGLIHELKEAGYLVFAVSGSAQEVVAKVAEVYGFDDFFGSNYVRGEHGFTGEVIVTAKDKPKYVRMLMERNGASLEGSIAVGDSEGDISMLGMVDHAIAFNPSKKLFLAALEHGWRVVVERKNMVYELEPNDGQYRLVHTNT